MREERKRKAKGKKQRRKIKLNKQIRNRKETKSKNGMKKERRKAERKKKGENQDQKKGQQTKQKTMRRDIPCKYKASNLYCKPKCWLTSIPYFEMIPNKSLNHVTWPDNTGIVITLASPTVSVGKNEEGTHIFSTYGSQSQLLYEVRDVPFRQRCWAHLVILHCSLKVISCSFQSV